MFDFQYFYERDLVEKKGFEPLAFQHFRIERSTVELLPIWKKAIHLEWLLI